MSEEGVDSRRLDGSARKAFNGGVEAVVFVYDPAVGNKGDGG